MRVTVLFALVAIITPRFSFADPKDDFDAALARWRNANIKSYTFVYELGGAVLISPKCGDANIRVRVKNGVGSQPIVACSQFH